MKNLKFTAIALALSTTAVTSAFASTAAGPYVGFGLGAYNANINQNGYNYSDQNPQASVGVFGGYQWNFGQEALAAELSYNSNVGEINEPSGTSKLKNDWQVSVLPGYNFTDSTEGYVRVGWTQANGDGAYSHTYQGAVLGLGVDHSITRNMALRLEWQYMNFNSFNPGSGDVNPTTEGVNVSLRYGF